MSINNAGVIGEKNKNLVLETAGKIYVKVADRYYELQFRDQNNGVTTVINQPVVSVEKEETTQPDLSKYITTATLRKALSRYVTKRDWNDVKETQSMLENAQLEGFTDSISPITVNTMQTVVGAESLQYYFYTPIVTDLKSHSRSELKETSPSIEISSSGALTSETQYVLHTTLCGPKAVQPDMDYRYYARWKIKAADDVDGDILYLSESDTPYYLYLKVERYKDYSDEEIAAAIEEGEDPKGEGEGELVVSTESFALEEEEGYYYLLCAIIASASEDNRSIGYMYGFTEILPGQITAYVFKTSDGLQYLDFLDGMFHIGNTNNAYLDYNAKSGILSIKGEVNITGGNTYNILNDLQKQIDDEIQNWFSDDERNYEEEKHKDPELDRWPVTGISTKDRTPWKYCRDAYINPAYDEEGEDAWKTKPDGLVRADGTSFDAGTLSNYYYKVRSSGTFSNNTYSYTGKEFADIDYNYTYQAHNGDLYYIVEGESKGNVWRFTYKDSEESAAWISVGDTDTAKALIEAKEAKASAADINTYLGTALADGVLTSTEKETLETYLKTLETEMQDVISSYEKLYNNVYLDPAIYDTEESTATAKAKKELKDAYDNLTAETTGKYHLLVAAVEAILAQATTVPGEKNEELKDLVTKYEEAYTEFNASLSAYTTAVETAQAVIEDNILTAAKRAVDNEYAYLKEAIQNGRTAIEGGLVLTNTIALGNTPNDKGKYDITAGINGITTIDGKTNSKAIAAWYGGGMNDKENPTEGSPSPYAKTLFRHDGSGYEAQGNISWDADGNGKIGGGLISWKDNTITISDDAQISGEAGSGQTLAKIIELQKQMKELFILHYIDDDESKGIESVEFKYSTWTKGYLSARGQDNSGESGGGVNLQKVWASLTKDPDKGYSPDIFADYIISPDHLAGISQDKITNLGSDLKAIRESISNLPSKVVSSLKLYMPENEFVVKSNDQSELIISVTYGEDYAGLVSKTSKSAWDTVAEMFVIETEGDTSVIRLNDKYAGFYTTGFISARGKDDSGESGGGVTPQEIWNLLTSNTDPVFGQTKIHEDHIPTLSVSKITGLAKVATSGQYSDLIGTPNIPQGTVTSVAMEVPTGFTVTGTPITKAGTITLSFTNGYSLPTEAKQSKWDIVADMFEIQSDNSVKLNANYKGLWTTGFISARGEDTTGSSGGGAAPEEIWATLTANTGFSKDYKIDVNHIPTGIAISNISGLQNNLNTLSSSIDGVKSNLSTNYPTKSEVTTAINNAITTATKNVVTSVTVSGTGNAVTAASTSGNKLTLTKGLTFFYNTGNGLAYDSGLVYAKKDSSSEEFLTISDSGFKISGVQNAINTAVNKALHCYTTSFTASSKKITVSGIIKKVTTLYGGNECKCTLSYDTVSSVTISLSSSRTITVHILYIPS